MGVCLSMCAFVISCCKIFLAKRHNCSLPCVWSAKKCEKMHLKSEGIHLGLEYIWACVLAAHLIGRTGGRPQMSALYAVA